jgi:cellobiose transport system permease protein
MTVESAPMTAEKGGRRKTAPSPWKSTSESGKPAKRRKPSDPKQAGIRALNGNWGYLFTAPFFISFLIFGLAPIVYSIYIAFFNWDALGKDNQFIGLDNFVELWNDAYFWNALTNTFGIWLLSTIPQMLISIGLAVALRSQLIKGQTFWRTVLLLPNITSVIAITMVFGQLFDKDFGMINLLLQLVGIPKINFLEDTFASHLAIAVIIMWRWAGYNALIFLASMLAIPNELYESASLDGATSWQQFRYVTLPGLRNTITFVLIMGTIGGLQVFAEPLQYGGGSYTGGDSRQFSTLTLYLFEKAFLDYRWGYAAAVGIFITFIVLIISAINFWLTRRIANEDKK